MLLLLTACRSAPPPHPMAAVDRAIQAGDTLATPENSGMTHYVRPLYLKEARRAHVEGEVKLNILIAKTGEVSELHVLSGNPVLVPPAITAVQQWRYAPCHLNSEPVEVKAIVIVPFTLHR
jgi:protein TonB